MVGRPIYRARIAAEIAAQGGVPPERPVYVKRGPGRPRKDATVVSSLPPKPVQQIVDTVDANFGAALAAAAGGTDMNSIFEELRTEAMRFALWVMKLEIDPDERSFNKLLGVKQQITTAVLTATTRVRPGDLRERDDDGLGALLDRLKSGEGPTVEDLLN